MKELGIKKLYYSISEVSKLTSLKAYVLRYWETEFSSLRPSKNSAGNRTYRQSDVELIYLIKKLLYEEKYTIDGARQKLKNMRISESEEGQQLDLSLNNREQEELINEIRQGLKDIADLFGNS